MEKGRAAALFHLCLFLNQESLATFSRPVAYVKAKPESTTLERRALMNYKRLYRSNRDVMLGGVAARLAVDFNIDPTIRRIVFLLLTRSTGGGFLVVYLALWLLITAAGSTATEANEVIHENVNEMGAKFRGFAAPRSTTGSGGTAGGEATMTSN